MAAMTPVPLNCNAEERKTCHDKVPGSPLGVYLRERATAGFYVEHTGSHGAAFGVMMQLVVLWPHVLHAWVGWVTMLRGGGCVRMDDEREDAQASGFVLWAGLPLRCGSAI